MAEPRMPTTLPSPADRDEFRFIAVAATGAVWESIDHEMVWLRGAEEAEPDGTARGGCVTVH